jgi:hypothetical protein
MVCEGKGTGAVLVHSMTEACACVCTCMCVRMHAYVCAYVCVCVRLGTARAVCGWHAIRACQDDRRRRPRPRRVRRRCMPLSRTQSHMRSEHKKVYAREREREK